MPWWEEFPAVWERGVSELLGQCFWAALLCNFELAAMRSCLRTPNGNVRLHVLLPHNHPAMSGRRYACLCPFSEFHTQSIWLSSSCEPVSVQSMLEKEDRARDCHLNLPRSPVFSFERGGRHVVV